MLGQSFDTVEAVRELDAAIEGLLAAQKKQAAELEKLAARVAQLEAAGRTKAARPQKGDK